MADFPLRRGQLIAPFGVGSIITSIDGISAIVGGLDHWIDSPEDNFNPGEFLISDEWRLSQELGVEHFVLPPDFRMPYGYQSSPNSFITLPAIRFPLWNFCPSCHKMCLVSPAEFGLWSCQNCQLKSPEKPRWQIPKVIQLQFLAMCQKGHIEDFPYKSWVHRRMESDCDGELSVSFAGSTLASQRVVCSCKKSRSFAEIFRMIDSNSGKTFLTNRLSATEEYLCRGIRPWLNDFRGEGCGGQLIGGLRGAINNYYSYTRSAIFLPRELGGYPEELIQLLQSNDFQKFLEPTEGIPGDAVLNILKGTPGLSTLLKPYVGQFDIGKAIDKVRAKSKVSAPADGSYEFGEQLKAAEFSVFSARSHVTSPDLKLKAMRVGAYVGSEVPKIISNVILVDRLRETRAFIGFGRIKPESDRSLGDMRRMLRITEDPSDRWLPAYSVFGEGIFLEFDAMKLDGWSKLTQVRHRVERLKSTDTFTRMYPNVNDDSFLPRFVALHTFSHLLINQMIFESGYSAAALKERIFCSINSLDETTANGLLIYTASGDSEGSMGGLVRLGQPGHLEMLVEAALDKAMFCSSDPVCMDFGEQGQGPDSLNLAACHSCALLPETSCEQFNTFLDRALIIGSLQDYSLGLLNH